MRSTLAAFVGYVIFALSAGLWFELTGHPPHQSASLYFEIITALYGSFFSLLSGFVAQVLDRNHSININLILMAAIVIGALSSLLLSTGSHWTQWMTLMVFAPLSIVGGYLRLKMSNQQQIES